MSKSKLHWHWGILIAAPFWVLLTDCAHLNGIASSPSPLFCDVAAPIYTMDADKLTDETASQILSYNMKWGHACNGQP